MRSAFPRIAPAFALHCARKTMPTRYQSRFRSILPPFLSIGGGGGYEIPDELALASVFSEMKWLAVEWWPIDRCHQKRKKKKRLRLSMPTINGFYSSWERSRNERTWSKAKGEGN